MGRKVHKGYFVDYPFADYGDCDLIGAHIAVSRENARIAKSKGIEYFVYDDDGKAIAIDDVTAKERFFASLKYVFKLNKSKIVGYRSSSPNYANFRLGVTYDLEGRAVVNEDYYGDYIARIESSSMPRSEKAAKIADAARKREALRAELAGGTTDTKGSQDDRAGELEEMLSSDDKTTGPKENGSAKVKK